MDIGNVSEFCKQSADIWYLLGTIINIIKIAIPILIVVLAMFDLGKAVMAGDEKEIKEAQKMLIKRLVFGVIIFFVVTVVQIVFSLIGQNLNNDDTKICWACATRPNSNDCYRGEAIKNN